MSNRFEEIEEEEEEIPSIDPKYANLGNTYCMTLKYLHYVFGSTAILMHRIQVLSQFFESILASHVKT